MHDIRVIFTRPVKQITGSLITPTKVICGENIDNDGYHGDSYA